jgi:hypothetical protein
MILTAICIYAVGLLLGTWPLWPRLLFKFIFISLFPLVLFWLGFYETIELERLGQFWSKWRNPLDWGKNLHKIKTD